MFKEMAWLYHKTKGAKLFKNEAEYMDALAKGWAESPALVDQAIADYNRDKMAKARASRKVMRNGNSKNAD